MSERTVTARLRADTGSFIASMKAAQQATEDFASKGVKSATDHKAAWSTLGQTSLVAGAALAAGVGLAVKAFADFDKEMSNVRAVSGATAGEMDKLRAAALKAGADTKYSASEAAKAEAELAKVGISTADILGGALTGSLNLAAAGNIDLGEAATISGQAMKIFNLAGKDVGHIADVLASGANKSAADVSSLGQALQQGGLVAAQTGLTLEETAGTLSLFADNALMGSDAGTSLKSMLQRLTPQSAEAAAQMKAVGFSAYDAQGNFKGMGAVAENLKTSFQGLTPEARNSAMGVIFGSDAVRAANILYKAGAIGVDEYTKAVNDDGAAARVAAIQMDNLSGDLEQLKGSIETALIQSGSGANSALRDMARFATSAVNAFGELPAPLQQGALGLASVGAAGLLAVGGFMTVMPKIAETKNALVALGLASKLTKANLMSVATGPIGIALTALTVVVGLFAKAQMDAKAQADDLRGSLNQETGAITDQTKALVAKQLQESGAFETAKAHGISIKTVTDAALGNAGALKELKDQQVAATDATNTAFVAQVKAGGGVAAMTHQTNVLTGATGSATDATATQGVVLGQLLSIVAPINGVLGGQTEKQKELAVAMGTTSGKANGLVQTEEDLKKAADAAKKAHDDLKAAIEGFGSATLDARGKARDYQAALDSATASLKDNGKTLDTNTEKGRANQVALEAIRTTALQSIVANYEHTGSVKALTTEVVAARGEFITMATRMGMSRTEAAALATELGLTTGNVKKLGDETRNVPVAHSTAFTQPGMEDSRTKAHLLKDAVFNIPNSKNISVGVSGYASAYQNLMSIQSAINAINNTTVRIATGSGGQGGITFSSGGYVRGAGTTTSDSIPARLSDKEFVVNAKATAANRPALEAINAGYAAGGYVSRPQPSNSGASLPTNGATSDDIAALAETTAALGDRFGAELDRQARTIETMRRQMVGAR